MQLATGRAEQESSLWCLFLIALVRADRAPVPEELCVEQPLKSELLLDEEAHHQHVPELGCQLKEPDSRPWLPTALLPPKTRQDLHVGGI